LGGKAPLPLPRKLCYNLPRFMRPVGMIYGFTVDAHYLLQSLQLLDVCSGFDLAVDPRIGTKGFA
jgi:hypothetical protein